MMPILSLKIVIPEIKKDDVIQGAGSASPGASKQYWHATNMVTNLSLY
jgi:hypothetical protein